MHTTLAVSNSSGTSSTGALPAPLSSPFAFDSGAATFCVFGVVVLALEPPALPLLLFFFFLLPFFLLLEAAAGPVHYREASFPISKNAHNERSRQGW